MTAFRNDRARPCAPLPGVEPPVASGAPPFRRAAKIVVTPFTFGPVTGALIRIHRFLSRKRLIVALRRCAVVGVVLWAAFSLYEYR